MSRKVLFLVLILSGVGLSGSAQAEKVRTNQPAKVTNRPGEQGKVLIKLDEGTAVVVLAEEGRWLKVRVAGRTGYLPRTVVDLPRDEEEDMPRNTRRRAFVDGRGKRRGFGGADGAPEDRIGADATGDNQAAPDDDEDEDEAAPKVRKGAARASSQAKPSPKARAKADAAVPDDADADEDDGDETEDADADSDAARAAGDEPIVDDRRKARVRAIVTAYADPDADSDESFQAKPGDVLYVESTSGEWTEVSVEDGDIGWILTSKLVAEDAGGPGVAGRRAVDVRARFGVTFFSQSLTSTNGTQTWPDAYKISSPAMAVALGGAYLIPFKKHLIAGGELTYDLGKSTSGFTFDPDGDAGPQVSATTGFTLHDLNVRGVLGYATYWPSGLTVLGRVGYHYESFLVENVSDLDKNTTRVPSEVTKGPMVGAAVALPRLTRRIGARFNLDAMPVGASITQTTNLEDGEDPSATRIAIGAGVSYRWKPSLDVQASYDLTYASVSFGAPIPTSMRGHMGSAVARTDVHQTMTIGVAKLF